MNPVRDTNSKPGLPVVLPVKVLVNTEIFDFVSVYGGKGVVDVA